MWEHLSAEERDQLAFADGLVDQMKRGDRFEEWHKIGAAINKVQAKAMAEVGTNRTDTPRYRNAWKEVMQHYPNLYALDKATRNHAMWLDTNWDAVLAWWQTLPANVRLKVNHPTTVRRRYDAAHTVPAPTVGPSPRLVMQDKLVALQEENDQLRALQGGSGLGLINGLSMEQLADMISEAHSTAAVRRLIGHLQDRLTASERQDRIEAQAQKRAKGRKPAAAKLADTIQNDLYSLAYIAELVEVDLQRLERIDMPKQWRAGKGDDAGKRVRVSTIAEVCRYLSAHRIAFRDPEAELAKRAG
jgi:hypothetical protein